MKQFLQSFALTLIGTLILTPLVLYAADKEAAYNAAKADQWKLERKQGLPFTNFSE